MLPSAALQDRPPGHLADNVLHFARVLREAGLPVGTDRPLLALEALRVAGIGSRADLHATLEACLIDRGEHRALFDQAFPLFWRDPDLLAQIMRMLLPSSRMPAEQPRPCQPQSTAGSREALLPQRLAHRSPRSAAAVTRIGIDAPLSWSDASACARSISTR